MADPKVTSQDFGKIASCISFFSSVIRSGEAWSESCDQAKREALDALARIGQQFPKQDR